MSPCKLSRTGRQLVLRTRQGEWLGGVKLFRHEVIASLVLPNRLTSNDAARREFPVSLNRIGPNWLFQPQSQAQPNQTESKQRAEEEKDGRDLLATEQEEADKSHQPGDQR